MCKQKREEKYEANKCRGVREVYEKGYKLRRRYEREKRGRGIVGDKDKERHEKAKINKSKKRKVKEWFVQDEIGVKK